jgi:hypothetical protein
MKFCFSRCAETGQANGEKPKPVKSDAAEFSAEYALAPPSVEEEEEDAPCTGCARDAAALELELALALALALELVLVLVLALASSVSPAHQAGVVVTRTAARPPKVNKSGAVKLDELESPAV